MTAENSLVGTWQLLSWENVDEEGNITYPFGEDAIGYVLYSEDGYMSTTLMTANRPNFETDDVLGGTTEERARAEKTYVAYCGEYEIKDNKVIHHIKASLFPNWVGVDQERFFEFNDERLTLSTPLILIDGKLQTAYLIWKRASLTKPT
ncbi:MAG: lipocalin-like domain-containing protein [Microcoleaceae cyanobacterium]|jgi:hypothetical protein